MRTFFAKFAMITTPNVCQYSSTCHEGTPPVRTQSVPSWQVVPRGRDRHFDRNICTLVHIIVYALLKHTQTRSESNENREIPSITNLLYSLYME